MGNARNTWSIGDSCFLVVSNAKRYAQEFKVVGFDGTFYSVRRGKYLHHVSPSRMFPTKEAAIASLQPQAAGEVLDTAEEQQTDESAAPVMGM